MRDPRPAHDLIDVSEKRAAEIPRFETIERGVLAADDPIGQRRVGDDLVDQPGDGDRVLVGHQHTGAVHRGGHRRGGVGNHRNAHVERFHQRHAETLVLARAQKRIGHFVVGDQLLVRHLTEEMNVGRADRRDEAVQHRQVALEAALRADEQQPRARIEPSLVSVKPADDVLDPLVRDDPADKQQVHPLVVEPPRQAPVRRPGEMREARYHRQHAGLWKAGRFELLAVELRVAQRQIAARGIEAELTPAEEAQLHEQRMHVHEVVGWRDVVIDQHHPIGQRVGDARCARSDREVMDQDVVGMAGLGQFAVVDREILEARIGGLDEDLRLIPRLSQYPLNGDDLVTDGIAIPEGRQHLVHGNRPALAGVDRHAHLPPVRRGGRRPDRRNPAESWDGRRSPFAP